MGSTDLKFYDVPWVIFAVGPWITLREIVQCCNLNFIIFLQYKELNRGEKYEFLYRVCQVDINPTKLLLALQMLTFVGLSVST